MLSSAIFLASVVIGGQSAGPTGATAVKSAEIKTLADAYAQSEKIATPEYMKRIVSFSYRASTGFEASRIETLVGPGKIRLKINDLNGLNVQMCGTPEEIWVLNSQEKVFARYPFGETPPGTAAIHQAIFGELNKDKPTNDEIGFQMKFSPSGMPQIVFAKPLSFHERKALESGEEMIFMGQIKNFDLTSILTFDSKGRITKATVDLVGEEGYTAHFVAETVVYLTSPLPNSEFAFPTEFAKGFKKMQDENSDGF